MVDASGPKGSKPSWAGIGFPAGAADTSDARDIIRNGVTGQGVVPISEQLPPVRGPKLRHDTPHGNDGEGKPGVAKPEGYDPGWYWGTSPVGNHQICDMTSPVEVSVSRLCWLVRNSAEQPIHEQLHDFTDKYFVVYYYACDRRVKGYWADREAAREAGFSAYDYCDRGRLEIGDPANPPRRLYPN